MKKKLYFWCAIINAGLWQPPLLNNSKQTAVFLFQKNIYICRGETDITLSKCGCE